MKARKKCKHRFEAVSVLHKFRKDLKLQGACSHKCVGWGFLAFLLMWLFYTIDAYIWDKRMNVTSANTQHNTHAICLTNVEAASEMKLRNETNCLRHHQPKTTL